MLDQVVPARPLTSRRGDDLPHRVELVVAREDHRFLGVAPLAALAVVDLFFLLLHEHEVPEDVEEAVALKHALPEVACAVARRMLWVAGAALHFARMAAAVEGQELRVRAAQSRRHVHLIRIGGEMHQRATLEAEQGRARIAVLLVLADRVAPGLAGARILEFAGRHRHQHRHQMRVHRHTGQQHPHGTLPRDRRCRDGTRPGSKLVDEQVGPVRKVGVPVSPDHRCRSPTGEPPPTGVADRAGLTQPVGDPWKTASTLCPSGSRRNTA